MSAVGLKSGFVLWKEEEKKKISLLFAALI